MAACGDLRFKWGVHEVNPESVTCDVSRVSSFSDERVYPSRTSEVTIQTGPNDFMTQTTHQPVTHYTSRSDLSMDHNKYYVALVQFGNLRADMASCTLPHCSVACSEPFLVDTTPPDAVGVVEHLDPDALVETVVASHDGNWLAMRWPSAFVDPEDAGVPLTYLWFVHQTPTPYPRHKPPSAGTATVFDTRGKFTTRDAQQYYVTIWAQNRAGRYTSITTTTAVTIDHTPPTAAAVRDGPTVGQDLDFLALTPGMTISVNWDEFTDNLGLVTYEVALGYVGGFDTLAAFRPADGGAAARSYTFSPASEPSLVLAPHDVVVATVRGTNEAGIPVMAWSSGVGLDDSAPVPMATQFVLAAHASQPEGSTPVSFQGHGSAFVASVGCTEDLDGQDISYSVTWSTDGAADVGGRVVTAGPSPAGTRALARSGAVAGIAHGDTVTAVVECTNSAGLSTTATAATITVDLTPPDASAASVTHVDTDLAGAPEVFFTAKDAIEATWAGFVDPESGMDSRCEWAVTTSAAGEPPAAAFTEATVVGYAKTDPAAQPLSHGVTYMFWVRCYNRAGGATTIRSAGILVHRLTPTGAVVRDGSGGLFQSPVSVASIDVSAMDGDLAGVAGNTAADVADGDDTTGVATGGSGGHTVTFHLAATSFVDSVVVSGLVIADAGLATTKVFASSLTVEVFSYPTGWEQVGTVAVAPASSVKPLPLFFAKRFVRTLRLTATTAIGVSEVSFHDADADGIDITASQPATLAASWTGAMDPTGIASASWRVVQCDGRFAGPPHVVLAETAAGVAADVASAATPLLSSFVPGVRYCTHVRLTSTVGLSAEFVSDGFVAFNAPPRHTFVYDGVQPLDADVQRSNSSLGASWEFADDQLAPGQSLVYEWGAGSSPGAFDALPSVTVGTATSAVAEVGLQTFATYYSSVRAVNPGGLSATGLSDGVRIDPTAPDLSEGVDGVEHVDLQSNPTLTALTGTWPSVGGAFEFFWKIGTSVHGDDLVGLTSVGTAASAAVTGLSPPLVINQTYFVDVFVRTDAGLSLYAHGSLLADNTPPVILGLLQSGGAEFSGISPGLTATYDASVHMLDVSWPPAADETTVTYAWSVGLQAGVASIYGPKDVGTALGDSVVVVLQPSPDPYYVTLTATSAGGSAEVSVGIIVDSGGPLFGWVLDGDVPGVDIRYQSAQDHLGCSFGGFLDPVSGIAMYLVGVGSDVGLWDIAGGRVLNTTQPLNTVFSGLQLDAGATYHCVVRAVDNRGFVSVRSSDGVTIEVDPPLAGSVFDGPLYHVDLEHQDSLRGVSASWDGFREPDSEIRSFDWGVGTAPGLDDVVPFRSVGLHTAASDPDVMLDLNVPYYSTVRCYNVRGMVSSASSDGFVVDHSAPTGVGVSASLLYLAATGTPQRTTCACVDAGAVFSTATGTCACPGGSLPVVAPGAAGGIEVTCNSQPTEGQQIQAVASPSACTPPDGRFGPHELDSSTCACAPGHYLDYTTQTCVLCPHDTFKDQAGDEPDLCVPCWFGAMASATLDATWTSAGADGFRVLAGTTPRVAPYSDTEPGSARAHSFTGLPIQQSSRWFVTVVAQAAGGGEASAQAPTPVVDFTPPRLGSVVDSGDADASSPEVAADSDFQTSTSTLAAAWFGFEDAESDVLDGATSLAFGSEPYENTISQGWLAVPATDAVAGAYRFTPAAPLVDGQRYFATLRVSNSRGFTATRVSDGVIVDSSPPVAVGSVVDTAAGCQDTDVAYVATQDAVRASWRGSFEDLHSGVVAYEYRVESGDGGPMHQPPAPLDSVETAWTRTTAVEVEVSPASFNVPQGHLVVGRRYVVAVRAFNGAGLASQIVYSNGVIVSTSHPFVHVFFMSGISNALASADAISVWRYTSKLFIGLVIDAHEGAVTNVEVSVGTSPGGAEVVSRPAVLAMSIDGDMHGIVPLYGLSLASGTMYYATARGVSESGVVFEDVVSTALLVDASDPVGGAVSLTPLPRPAVAAATGDAMVGFSPYLDRVAASIAPFADSESGVSVVEAGLGGVFSSPDDETLPLVDWTPVELEHDGSFTMELHGLALAEGLQVRVLARATNGAGGVAGTRSEPLTTDASPPLVSPDTESYVRVATTELPQLGDFPPPPLGDNVWLAHGDRAHVSWENVFGDPHSGVARFEWSVVLASRGPGGAVVLQGGTPHAGPFAALEGQTSDVVEMLGLGHGSQYVVCRCGEPLWCYPLLLLPCVSLGVLPWLFLPCASGLWFV